jgi:hypothetical protein
MIALLLGWTKLPQWAMELIVIGAIAGGGTLWWQHHSRQLIAEGVSKQQAADNAVSQPLIDKAKADTAALQVKALVAEQTHAKEMADLQNLISSRPNQPVRLCLDSNAHGSGASVRPTSTANSGNKNAGTAAAGVQPVSDGNSSSGTGQPGPDIEPMLTALGAAADKVSAELREIQSR